MRSALISIVAAVNSSGIALAEPNKMIVAAGFINKASADGAIVAPNADVASGRLTTTGQVIKMASLIDIVFRHV
jgi:hypothetical protein